MSTAFQHIGLFGKVTDSQVADTIRDLVAYLHGKGLQVTLDDDTADKLGLGGDTASYQEIGEQCDLAIVVGGDGTMLVTARRLANHDIVILGINLGRLGFLADISPSHIEEKLDSILAGNYIEEERFLLHAAFVCEAGETTESLAFNEVVVHKWNVARMIELDTYINNQYVNTTRSDGLIVSTPTGSSAYALSGGGPLLHPSLNSVVLVPICPHTMSHRPLVVSGDSRIEITINKHNTEDAQVTCDGQVNFNLMPGDRVVITRYQRPLRLIHPESYNYYEILRAKLHWSRKLSN
jgi:NAD+ kinase